jgi:demethylmenaquinone methyltransferase / 2-methoxy-6-polyprenyl-1,4-benzoquinol methylase
LSQQQTISKGVVPKRYSEIQEGLESSDKKVKFVMYLFSDGPVEYDFLLKILSMGRDGYWRREIVKRALCGWSDGATNRRSDVLDIACGTGLVTFDFASKVRGTVVAVDVTKEMLSRAKELRKGKRFTADSIEFIQARAENLPLRSDYFDCATISLATRNVSSVSGMLGEMERCVKSQGVVISMDFTRPRGRIFAPFYRFYIFNLLPTLGLVISRHWNGIFAYLAGSIQRSKTPEEIERVMRSVGLEDTKVKRMTLGVTAVVSGVKKTERNG